MKLFNIEGSFYDFGTKLFDILMLNILWVIGSVLGLGLTLGISTTALYYTMDKTVIHGRGYLLRNYMKSFKLNIKQATIIWIILALGYSLIAFNFYVMDILKSNNLLVIIIHYFVLVELVFITIYIFPLLAKLELSIKDLFVKSLLLAHKHFLTSITCVSIYIVFALLIINVHAVFAIIAVSGSGYMISRLIIGIVLPKYVSKEKLTTFHEE